MINHPGAAGGLPAAAAVRTLAAIPASARDQAVGLAHVS